MAILLISLILHIFCKTNVGEKVEGENLLHFKKIFRFDSLNSYCV